MTVLIAGAGIGGLTLGLTLHQLGIPFRIFEAVDQLRPLGVGINLQPHASRELFELGLEKDLDASGLRTEEVAYFSRHGKQIWSEQRGLKAGYRWPQFSIHRGHMQMALYRSVIDRAGAGAVVSGHSLTDWSEAPDGITASFADRKTGKTIGSATGALLIAADGINSTARARLFPDEGPASWGGTMMWRGVTKGPRFLTGRSVAMTGTKSVKFVCYPIADTEDGSVLNWVADLAMPPGTQWRQQDWNREGRLEDFLPRFDGWSFDWLDIPEVIRSAEAIYEFPMVDREPLDRWTHGRMTLLGDAAHAMYPIGSNGASQGILDARILGRCLRDHGVTPEALAAYDDARREEVNAVVLANRGDGPDRILDIVDERAPDGFDRIEDVISQEDLARAAGAYKAVAGMDIATLNARPSIL